MKKEVSIREKRKNTTVLTKRAQKFLITMDSRILMVLSLFWINTVFQRKNIWHF